MGDTVRVKGEDVMGIELRGVAPLKHHGVSQAATGSALRHLTLSYVLVIGALNVTIRSTSSLSCSLAFGFDRLQRLPSSYEE